MSVVNNLYKRSNVLKICTRKYSLTRVNFAQTHYEVLELTESCTDAEIKEAFYKKIKLLHPDKNPQNSRNHQLAVAVNEAYAVLGKKHSRENYDFYLSQLRGKLSRTNISDIPYDRVIFRDRDHFYEDNLGGKRFYEETFYRGGGFYENPYYHSRGKSREEKPYYGIKGVNRLPNSYIAAGVVLFFILGAIFHYKISLMSTKYCLRKLHERDENCKEIYKSVRENASKCNMEEQLLRMGCKDPIKFNEETSKRGE